MLEMRSLYDTFRATPTPAAGSGPLPTEVIAVNELSFLRCASAATSDFDASDSSVANSFTSHYTGCSGPAGAQGPGVTFPTTAFGTITLTSGRLGIEGIFSPNTRNLVTTGGSTAYVPTTKSGRDTTDIADGLSNTMAIIETSRGDFVGDTSAGQNSFTNERHAWSVGARTGRINWARSVVSGINSFDTMAGTANPYHEICISSNHSGGANVANGDGSTHFVIEDTDLGVLQALAGVEDSITTDLDQ